MTQKLVSLSEVLDNAVEAKLHATPEEASKEFKLTKKELFNAHTQISILKKEVNSLKMMQREAESFDKRSLVDRIKELEHEN